MERLQNPRRPAATVNRVRSYKPPVSHPPVEYKDTEPVEAVTLMKRRLVAWTYVKHVKRVVAKGRAYACY